MRKIKLSTRLNIWMKEFYGWSSDSDNKESKLTKEFLDLKEIIKDLKRLEND